MLILMKQGDLMHAAVFRYEKGTASEADLVLVLELQVAVISTQANINIPPPYPSRSESTLSSTTLHPLSSSCMDDLSCLGCAKSFATQKRLSAHEAQCAANKSLDTNIYKNQRRLEKEKRRKRKRRRRQEESQSPTPREQTPPAHNSPHPDEQMDVNNGWQDMDHEVRV
ncbi:hypothetical protein EDB19DRAFT_1833535 [Suillus lakei]|nr:hypothetical protein EDB19DRAFT_1833535 [Suillus lakei]